ncbi:MAG: hypothetical protein AAFZ18_28200, partial [Myxococcota bacterium]
MTAVRVASLALLLTGVGASPGSVWAQPSTVREEGSVGRELESKLIAFGEAGLEPVFGGLSAQADTNGLVPSDDTLGTSNVLFSTTLAGGAYGLGLSSLEVYGLGSGRWDFADAGTTGLFVHPDLVHRREGASTLWLQSAYAGLTGLASEGLLSHVHVRAGRQFHQVERLGMNFDGVTLGFDNGALSFSGRVGTRSATYDRTHGLTEPFGGGLVAGGQVGYDFRAQDIPFGVEAEVLHHSRNVRLIPREAEVFAEPQEVSGEITMARLAFDWQPSTSFFIHGYAIAALPTLSHIVVYGQYALSSETVLTVQFYQKVERGILYDIASLRGIERRGRRTTYESLRLNLVDRQPYSDLEASLLVPLGDVLWLDGRLGGRLGLGDETERTVYDASQARYGLDLVARIPLSRSLVLESTVGGDGWLYMRPDGIEDATFRGLGAGGETFVQEGRVDVQLVSAGRRVGRRMLGPRRFSVSGTGFFRYAELDNQFLQDEEEFGEITAGAGAQASFDPLDVPR